MQNGHLNKFHTYRTNTRGDIWKRDFVRPGVIPARLSLLSTCLWLKQNFNKRCYNTLLHKQYCHNGCTKNKQNSEIKTCSVEHLRHLVYSSPTENDNEYMRAEQLRKYWTRVLKGRGNKQCFFHNNLLQNISLCKNVSNKHICKT